MFDMTAFGIVRDHRDRSIYFENCGANFGYVIEAMFANLLFQLFRSNGFACEIGSDILTVSDEQPWLTNDKVCYPLVLKEHSCQYYINCDESECRNDTTEKGSVGADHRVLYSIRYE